MSNYFESYLNECERGQFTGRIPKPFRKRSLILEKNADNSKILQFCILGIPQENIKIEKKFVRSMIISLRITGEFENKHTGFTNYIDEIILFDAIVYNKCELEFDGNGILTVEISESRNSKEHKDGLHLILKN